MKTSEKNVALNDEHKKKLIDQIHFSVPNIEIRNLLLQFFEENIIYLVFKHNQARLEEVWSIFVLISMFEEMYDIEEMGWESYCVHMWKINEKEGPNRITNIGGRSRLRLSQFYVYVAKNSKNKAVIMKLNSCINLFIEKEIRATNDSIFYKEFKSNYPLNSKPTQILHIGETSKTSGFFNINLNTENKLIHELIRKFIDTLPRSKLNYIESRCFFYYFYESLQQFKGGITEIISFNNKVFKQQRKFFKEIDEKMSFPTNKNTNTLLVKFYLFLDKYYYLENGELLFNSGSFNSQLLKSPYFFGYIDGGYELVYHAPQDPMPVSDKWVLLTNPYEKTASMSRSNHTIDASKVENLEYREELKKYLWNRRTSNSNKENEFRILIRFLNTANLYQKEMKEVIPIRGDKNTFSNEFILKYRVSLENRITQYGNIPAKRTVNNELTAIKNYLSFYKEKYNITEIALEQLKHIKKEFTGGNPMTPGDFKNISAEFRERSKTKEIRELYYIIFKLSITTKLRLGEILNLKRDCILSINESLKAGEIKYIPKTNEGKEVREYFLIEDIKLIKRAIELTDNCIKHAPKEIENFIFLSYHGNRTGVLRLTNQFTFYFREIVDKLYQQGLLEKQYTAYHSRHTYIDNAWQRVEDGEISSLEIGVVTGNSAGTAREHYRKRDIKRYVEAVYGIVIGNVNIDGEIIDDGKEIEDLPQVQDGAGACKSDECIKINENDSDYVCLTCSKFITSLGRTAVFEKRLEFYKTKKNEATSPAEKQYYNTQSELYGSYLIELYEKSKKSKEVKK